MKTAGYNKITPEMKLYVNTCVEHVTPIDLRHAAALIENKYDLGYCFPKGDAITANIKGREYERADILEKAEKMKPVLEPEVVLAYETELMSEEKVIKLLESRTNVL